MEKTTKTSGLSSEASAFLMNNAVLVPCTKCNQPDCLKAKYEVCGEAMGWDEEAPTTPLYRYFLKTGETAIEFVQQAPVDDYGNVIIIGLRIEETGQEFLWSDEDIKSNMDRRERSYVNQSRLELLRDEIVALKLQANEKCLEAETLMHYIETGENKLPPKPSLKDLFKTITGDGYPELQDFLDSLDLEPAEEAPEDLEVLIPDPAERG